MRLSLVCLLLMSYLATAMAQDYETLLDIPPGSTLVNLSATERALVDEDLLVANLRFEAQDNSPRALQDKINTVMTKALDEASKVASVKSSTGAYQVYQLDLNRGRDTPAKLVWRGQQGLTLKGKQPGELLDLVATLQGMGLAMRALNYMVSPELRRQQRDALLEAALSKLAARADRVAKVLGKANRDFLQISVDTGGYGPPPPVARSMATMESAAAHMTAPVAAPGESEVTLTVSAQVLLAE